ncbi:MAG: alpha/beta hydrolase [Nitrospirae bacterium]|nr:alpha/beta hydrolase [Nitrospirota bacterium]
MDLDITIHRGGPGKPAVIFIHGLGMDKYFWTNPLETKIFAKNIPLKVFAATRPRPASIKSGKKLTIGSVPKNIDTLWTVLRDKGFNLLCWSQRRPVGPIDAAVEELDEIMQMAGNIFRNKPLAIIGHSRGGLIARKFMEREVPGLKALITLSTPHRGSSLSRIGKRLAPLSAFLKGTLPGDTHGAVSRVLKNVADLLEANALKELMPGSDFFRDLKDAAVDGTNYLSFGGTKTGLLTLYKWKKEGDELYPKPLLIIPDSLIKVLPASIIPDELRPGKGDFMVTAESSVLPWPGRHYNLRANHISIAWNRKMISTVTEALELL